MSCCLSQDSCETRPVLTVSFRFERGDQFESGFQFKDDRYTDYKMIIGELVVIVFANYLMLSGFLQDKNERSSN